MIVTLKNAEASYAATGAAVTYAELGAKLDKHLPAIEADAQTRRVLKDLAQFFEMLAESGDKADFTGEED